MSVMSEIHASMVASNDLERYERAMSEVAALTGEIDEIKSTPAPDDDAEYTLVLERLSNLYSARRRWNASATRLFDFHAGKVAGLEVAR